MISWTLESEFLTQGRYTYVVGRWDSDGDNACGWMVRDDFYTKGDPEQVFLPRNWELLG